MNKGEHLVRIIAGFDMKSCPVYLAIETLKQLTENRQLAVREAAQNSGAYAFRFSDKKDKLFILWTSAGKLAIDTAGFKTHFILPKQPTEVVNSLGEKNTVASKPKCQKDS